MRQSEIIVGGQCLTRVGKALVRVIVVREEVFIGFDGARRVRYRLQTDLGRPLPKTRLASALRPLPKALAPVPVLKFLPPVHAQGAWPKGWWKSTGLLSCVVCNDGHGRVLPVGECMYLSGEGGKVFCAEHAPKGSEGSP